MILSKAEVYLDRVRPNPHQPRQKIDPDKLRELAQSIEEQGLIQPISIEARDDVYIIHGGERRWRASCYLAIRDQMQTQAKANGDDHPAIAPLLLADQIAALPAEEIIKTYRAELENAQIDVVVVAPGTSDQELLLRAIVENDQRDDLSPLDRAKSYQRLKDEYGLSDNDIAKRVGRSRTAVTNARRLLDLPDDVQGPVAAGEISERQAQALLPAYQLPEPALKQLGDHHWYSPKKLLEAAKKGKDSTDLRADVNTAIDRVTNDTKDWGWFNHTFEALEGVQSSCCAGCPILVKRGQSNRCPDAECAKIKLQGWAAIRLEEATRASGLSPIELTENAYGIVERFYNDGAALKEIFQEGCPRDNLRIGYEPGSGYAAERKILDGFADIEVVCRKGKGSHCHCLAARRREEKKNDPTVQEEKERKRILEEEIVAPAAQALIEAFKRNDVGAWRLLLPPIASTYSEDASGWDMDKILTRMTRAMIFHALPYNPATNVDQSRSKAQEYLAKAGLSLPAGSSELHAIEEQFNRILGWIRGLVNETPKIPAVEGNIKNLADLVELLDNLPEAQEDKRVLALTRRVVYGVDALSTIKDVLYRRSKLFQNGQIKTSQGWDAADFAHVEWLTNGPVDSDWTKDHLLCASADALAYALALTMVESEAHARQRASMIELRLAELEAPVEVPLETT